MSDAMELKPKSFRITDETAEKFKEIAAQLGGNQQEVMSKLIEAYEFQAGKAVLAEKVESVEQFERYVTCLTRMYMDSLEDNQNVTETVRTEFEALLKSKDVTIQDLQGKVTAANQIKEEATVKAKTFAEENARLNTYIESLTKEYEAKSSDLMEMLADKEKLNTALTDAHADLKARLESLSGEHEELQKLQREIAQIEAKAEKATLAQAAAEKALNEALDSHKLSMQRQQEQLQLAHEKELLEVEKKHQKELQEQAAQKQAEVDSYQKKYMELLEQLQAPQPKKKTKKTAEETAE